MYVFVEVLVFTSTVSCNHAHASWRITKLCRSAVLCLPLCTVHVISIGMPTATWFFCHCKCQMLWLCLWSYDNWYQSHYYYPCMLCQGSEIIKFGGDTLKLDHGLWTEAVTTITSQLLRLLISDC